MSDTGKILQCEPCDPSCLTCFEGGAHQCSKCKKGWRLVKEGQNRNTCQILEECAGDPDCNSRFGFEMIAWLLNDLKFSYLLMLIFLIMILMKLTCKRNMSLLIGIVIISASIKAMTLLALLCHLYLIEPEGLEITEAERMILLILPIIFYVIQLILNTCVTCQYFRSIKKPLKRENEDQQDILTNEIWQDKICTCSRITCLTASILLSFHNTSWLNISGQLPLALKRRLFLNGFTISYSRASKLSIILPLVPTLVYIIYFGVSEAFMRMNDFSIKMAILDLAIVNNI